MHRGFFDREGTQKRRIWSVFLPAKVGALITHTWHHFVLVNYWKVVRKSREEKSYAPFAVCDTRSWGFSQHRCTYYFTSKWKGRHHLSCGNYMWENWDCVSYMQSKAWFWDLGVTPSLLALVELGLDCSSRKGYSRCRWVAYRDCLPHPGPGPDPGPVVGASGFSQHTHWPQWGKLSKLSPVGIAVV